MIMKFVAFADMHCSPTSFERVANRAKKEDIDGVICAGDLSIFGTGIETMLKKLDKIGKPIFIVPGNHEAGTGLRELCGLFKNLVYMNKRMVKFKDATLIGCEGNGFTMADPEFQKWGKKVAKKIRDKENVVLITHAPPYGTKLDVIDRQHLGNRAVKYFLDKNPSVKVAVSGHFHETQGLEDKVNNARLVNPGPNGKVIEL